MHLHIGKFLEKFCTLRAQANFESNLEKSWSGPSRRRQVQPRGVALHLLRQRCATPLDVPRHHHLPCLSLRASRLSCGTLGCTRLLTPLALRLPIALRDRLRRCGRHIGGLIVGGLIVGRLILVLLIRMRCTAHRAVRSGVRRGVICRRRRHSRRIEARNQLLGQCVRELVGAVQPVASSLELISKGCARSVISTEP